MRSYYKKIRETIIPDIQVKMLDLCLSDNTSQMFIPTTPSAQRQISINTDNLYQEIINTRLKNKKLSRACKNKLLYESVTMEIIDLKEPVPLYEILSTKIVPITLRKHLLYGHTGAG